MKKILSLAVLLISLMFTSCHLEEPTGIDISAPEVSLQYLIQGNDTLYNYQDSLFQNFTDSLIQSSYTLEFTVEDTGNLYKTELYAVSEAGNEYLLASKRSTGSGKYSFEITPELFPSISENDFQMFYLQLKALDETENVGKSNKAGFYVSRISLIELFGNNFPKFSEVTEDSVATEKYQGKLFFMQFMAYQCLSCIEEATIIRDFITNHEASFDVDFSAATFGSHPVKATFTNPNGISLKYMIDQKTENNLNQDVFYDEDQYVKHFWEDLLNIEIGNDVFAFFPDGSFEVFSAEDSGLEFAEWLEAMYDKSKNSLGGK